MWVASVVTPSNIHVRKEKWSRVYWRPEARAFRQNDFLLCDVGVLIFAVGLTWMAEWLPPHWLNFFFWIIFRSLSSHFSAGHMVCAFYYDSHQSNFSARQLFRSLFSFIRKINFEPFFSLSLCLSVCLPSFSLLTFSFTSRRRSDVQVHVHIWWEQKW